MIKTCRECKLPQALTDFALLSIASDGRNPRCRNCANKRNRDYRAKFGIKRRTAEQQCHQREQQKIWILRNRHKIRAHKTLRAAIRSGKITKKPCEMCGEEKVEGHHEDYSKRLDVAWLCHSHHVERHRELRRNGVVL